MKYEMFTKRKVFFIWWAAGMLHIVCILEPYLTCGTLQNWVTQNCTQGFVRPCIPQLNKITLSVNLEDRYGVGNLSESTLKTLKIRFSHLSQVA